MKREAVKGMARKLSRSAGFTLAETLMTILILLRCKRPDAPVNDDQRSAG